MNSKLLQTGIAIPGDTATDCMDGSRPTGNRSPIRTRESPVSTARLKIFGSNFQNSAYLVSRCKISRRSAERPLRYCGEKNYDKTEVRTTGGLINSLTSV